MADMIAQRFWVVLPYHLIADHPQLRLSPMGVVPQRNRRDRPIVDYSFSKVNQDTVPIAPAESMQFGRAFDRLLYYIHHANRSFGPVYRIKIDLSDGFYRLRLTDSHAPMLGVAFPHLPSEPPLVAIPLVLPMGWVSSPPFFCALTETAADLANWSLAHSMPMRPHPLSRAADHPTNSQRLPTPAARHSTFGPQPVTLPASLPVVIPAGSPSLHPLPSAPPLQRHRPSHPLSYVDVYMDDFLCLAQGHPGRRSLVRSTLLHSIDQVLRPLHLSDPPHRKQPISLKKLDQGDGKWYTRKVLLGWVVDTVRETIELPTHRSDRLHTILATLLHRKRISLKHWQQQLGELRSMVLALPGGRGLFSTLYTGLTQPLHHNRVRLSTPMLDAIRDLQHLANDLSTRPTRLGEIVDTLPAAWGAADASGFGMGGIWLSTDPYFPPTLWRASFPDSVQQQLISWSNPSGSITNSDLELLAQIASQDIMVHLRDCRVRSLATFTDNTSAQSWQRKGSRATLGPAAYLLRLLSLHQRHYRYRATSDYIAEPTLALLPPATRHAFCADHSAAMQAFRAGIVPSRAQSRDAQWLRWQDYCTGLDLEPTLESHPDPISHLQVFAQRYRTGSLSPSRLPVRARTVEVALRSIGQTISSLGAPDPRLDSHGTLHYKLQQQLKGYAGLDPCPSRVKPIPFSILVHVYANASTPAASAVADMAILGFFFLLRPGEHTFSSPSADTQPFTLQSVTFRIGGTLLPAATSPIASFQSATFATLCFSRQKNGTTNELIGHARSGHSTICPVLALIRRCTHLRSFQAPPTTPLCSYFNGPLIVHISSQHLTSRLRESAAALLPTTGFPPQEVSARALRAGGAMALLCAQVDDNIIKLVGRWRSDQMLRYLHLQAYPHMHTFANRMVAGGNFHLLHNQPLPATATTLLAQVP